MKNFFQKNDVLTLRMTDIPWIEYVDPKVSTNEEKKRIEEEEKKSIEAEEEVEKEVVRVVEIP